MLSKHVLAMSVSMLAAVIPIGATATAQRTFVASTGADINSCNLTQPCRSFASAITQTAAGGEVIVLDSAGYGPVTITQSVSIIAPSGVYGGITVQVGEGITVNGPLVDVVLRGLNLNGHGGHTGIDFSQGSKLTVEGCEIANMITYGIVASALNSKVVVRNTVLRSVDNGFVALGTVEASLDRAHIENAFTGVGAYAGSRVTISNSVFVSIVGNGVLAHAASGAATDVMVTHSIITGSAGAIGVAADSGSAARVVSDANAINNAAIAAFAFGNGGGTETIYTSGTNTVGNNSPVTGGGVLTPIGQH